MGKQISIAHRKIAPTEEPFIIAELSGNHLKDFSKALRLIEVAKEAGADAVKLQTYTPDTITMNSSRPEFQIQNPKGLWDKENLYSLYSKACTPWEWHEKLFEKIKELEMIGFSTPFDQTSVDFLESFDVPCYKIASPEIIDIPLIQKCSSTGKPLIISCGMATVAEIFDAIHAAKLEGATDILLLKCTSAYPTPDSALNLRTIPHMEELFSLPIGLSDHSLGIGGSVGAVALGACAIEKHLTLDRSLGGPDAAFSLEPKEFKLLVTECKRAFHARGNVFYGTVPCEGVSYNVRKSLYFAESLPKGTIITPHHVRSIRPAKGLSPKYLSVIVGMRVQQDVEKGEPVSWGVFQA